MSISAIFAMGSGYDTDKFRCIRKDNYDGFDRDRGYFYEDHNGDFYYYNGYNSFDSARGCRRCY